ncbi:MAG: 1-acyl-sn-glycerol-3-phosphate acyltransferase [Chloroflexi bacterium]|nr:1-acyl-sn-glycerol-3-phosphate acyltransferase [Chloroflexota bacterium]
MLSYEIVRALAKLVFRLLTRYEVSGRENLPGKGPLLLVFNHLSHWDPPLLVAILPRRFTGLAVEGLRRVPVTGLLLSMAGVIWLRRGEFDRAALRRALGVLERNEVLAIAPEGRISKTGTLERGKTGPAFLARQAKVPILPIAVFGTEQLLPDLRKFRRPHIRINIGPLFHLDDDAKGRSRKEALQADADLIMRKLAELLPAEYRGVYAGASD